MDHPRLTSALPLSPKQVRLLLARLLDETLVLLEREDGGVDLEINPVLHQEWESDGQ